MRAIRAVRSVEDVDDVEAMESGRLGVNGAGRPSFEPEGVLGTAIVTCFSTLVSGKGVKKSSSIQKS